MKGIRLLPLIGVAVFIAILWNIDLGMIAQTFMSLDPGLILIALLLQVPIIVIKAFKWKLLVRSLSAELPLRKSISAWLIGFSIGLITPGRVGDFSRAYYVRESIGFGKSLTTVMVDRIIDVFNLFVLAVFGIAVFMAYSSVGIGSNALLPLFLGFFAAFIAFIYSMTRKGLVTRIASPFFRRIVPERHKGNARRVFHDFYRGLGLMKKRKGMVIISAAICFVSWLMIILQTYVISLSMGMGLPLIVIASIIPTTILIDALPISFSGLGTRDAAMIFLLGMVAIAPETAVAFSLLILTFNYLIVALFGFMLWLRNPISMDSIRSLPQD